MDLGPWAGQGRAVEVGTAAAFLGRERFQWSWSMSRMGGATAELGKDSQDSWWPPDAKSRAL